VKINSDFLSKQLSSYNVQNISMRMKVQSVIKVRVVMCIRQTGNLHAGQK